MEDLDTFETRLETRTKESSMCASHWAFSQCVLVGLRCSNVTGRCAAWESFTVIVKPKGAINMTVIGITWVSAKSI